MTDGCCAELEARLQALGVFDPDPPPSPSIAWSGLAGLLSLASNATLPSAILSIGSTLIVENLPLIQDALTRDEGIANFSGVTSIEDLRDAVQNALIELPPPTWATGAGGPYNIHAILQHFLDTNFRYRPDAMEVNVIQGFSKLQDGFGDEFNQFQSNLPIILDTLTLVTQHSELVSFMNTALGGLNNLNIDPTNFLIQFSSQSSDQLNLLLSILNNPAFTEHDVTLLAENYAFTRTLVSSEDSQRRIDEYERFLSLGLGGSLQSDSAQAIQAALTRERGREGLYTLVQDDPSLVGDLAVSPVVTAMINELFQSEQLQQVVSEMISNKLLSSEGGAITGALQAAVTQAVDTRLGEYGFDLPTIVQPGERFGHVNPSTGGDPVLVNANDQQVEAVQLFEPIDNAVAEGIEELEKTGQLTTENVTTTLQPIIDAALGAIETAKQNAINAIAAQHALLAAANLVLPAFRLGPSSDQPGRE